MSEDAPEVRIRHAEPGDVPALLEFIHPFVLERRLLRRTEQELNQLVSTGFVAESGGRIVGFAALEVYSPKLAELRSLAVAPELHGRGIGRQLVQHCIDLAHERSVLEVMAITSSEDFFRSCGFDFTLPGEKKALFVRTRDED